MPVSPVGRCGSIRAHCLSFSQNKPARILSPPNQEHVGKGITRRYLGTDPKSFQKGLSLDGGRSLHALISQAIRPSHFGAEDMIHALYHVGYYFAGRVPNTKALPEFRIEGLEERLIKVLYCFACVEGFEECLLVHPIECFSSSIKDWNKAQCAELAGSGDLLKERLHLNLSH
jgi:hypothetical protein